LERVNFGYHGTILSPIFYQIKGDFGSTGFYFQVVLRRNGKRKHQASFSPTWP